MALANTTLIQILRSYANSKPLSLSDGQLAYSFVSNTLFIGSNTSVIPIASVTSVNQANSASANTVYLQGGLNTANANIAYILDTNLLQNTLISSANTFAQSVFVLANNANYNTNYLQGGLNTANANIAYILSVDQLQNTNIGLANTLAQTATSLAVAAGANTVYLQTNLNTANANIAYVLSVDLLQNTNIGLANTLAQTATSLAVAASANTVYIQNNLNTANANIAYILVTNLLQNTGIGLANTLAQTATSLAQTAGANTVYIQNNLNTANANIAYILSVDQLQNTGIGLANTLAQSAFALAVTKFANTGGTISGPVTINSDLSVTGSIYLTGNAFTISANNNLVVNDAIIYLAANNPANLLDLGIVSHFVTDHYQHTGLIRDHNDGKWKFFSNVSTEPSTTVNFGEANTIYDTVKVGTIEAATANIGGTNLAVFANQAFTQANVAVAGVAYTAGVDLSQNTNITNANTLAQTATSLVVTAGANTVYLQSALNVANANIAYILTVDQLQNTGIGLANTLAQTATSLAQTAGANTVYTFGVDIAQNTLISSANTFAQSVFVLANNANYNTNYLQGGLNTANANIAYILTVDQLQNTGIGLANTLAQTATSLVIVAGANTVYTFGVDLTQNTNISNANTLAQTATSLSQTAGANTVYLQSALNVANANISYILVVNNLQNTGISLANTLAQTATTLASTAGANTVYLQSALNSANANITYLFGVINTDNTAINTAASNTVYTFGVDSYQNTAIGNANTLAQTATSLVVSAGANTVYLTGGLNSANANLTYLFGGLNSANANIAYILAIQLSQNTNITVAGTTANNALPNTGSIITVNGTSTLIIANTTQTTSNSTGALVVKGGAAVTGNLFTGNITIIAANSGVITTNAGELVLSSTGDSLGPITLRLQNRTGMNGALFDASGSTVPLVDFAFKTSANTRNIRYETRSIYSGLPYQASYTSEFQFFTPATSTPNFIISDYQAYALGNTASSNTTTGSFIVKGGVGVTGNVYADKIYTNGLFYSANGNPIQTGGGGGSFTPWQLKTTNYSANNGDNIIADTTTGPFIITLPDTPTSGYFIQITDGNDWSANNLTVARNGSTIENISDDLLVTLKGVTVQLVYAASTWQVTATTGSRGPTGNTGSIVTTYETIAKNLSGYPYTMNYSANVLISTVYTTPSSSTITKSFNYSSGILSSIVITGASLSNTYTKIFTYTNGLISSVGYTVT